MMPRYISFWCWIKKY